METFLLFPSVFTFQKSPCFNTEFNEIESSFYNKTKFLYKEPGTFLMFPRMIGLLSKCIHLPKESLFNIQLRKLSLYFIIEVAI